MKQELEQKLLDLVYTNSFAQEIGMEIVSVTEGHVKGRIKLEPKHMNVYNGMHGGCIYSLADTVAGIAGVSYGQYVTTVNGSMNYLIPVRDTDYVNCEAKVVRQGNKVGIYDVLITGDEGQLFANGSFTYYRLNKKVVEDEDA